MIGNIETAITEIPIEPMMHMNKTNSVEYVMLFRSFSNIN